MIFWLVWHAICALLVLWWKCHEQKWKFRKIRRLIIKIIATSSEMYTITVVPVVLYGYKTSYLALTEGQYFMCWERLDLRWSRRLMNRGPACVRCSNPPNSCRKMKQLLTRHFTSYCRRAQKQPGTSRSWNRAHRETIQLAATRERPPVLFRGGQSWAPPIDGGNYVMRSSIICSLRQILLVWWNQGRCGGSNMYYA
jgi:hypothetical protein